jgi:hypothetical protein
MPEPKEGRKLIPDPGNEPDFDTISSIWPVPVAVSAPKPHSPGKSAVAAQVAALAGFLPGRSSAAKAASSDNMQGRMLARPVAATTETSVSNLLRACLSNNSGDATRSFFAGAPAQVTYNDTPSSVAFESGISALIRGRMCEAASNAALRVVPPPVTTTESQMEACIRAHLDRTHHDSLSNASISSLLESELRERQQRRVAEGIAALLRANRESRGSRF